mgnify:CR=1 FL=1
MGSVLFEAIAQSVKDPYEVNSTEDMGSVCIGVNKLIREKIDREIEDETNGVLGNSIDNADETIDYSPKSCDISRNESLGRKEQGEMEDRAGSVRNSMKNNEKTSTETEPSSTRENGQQLMWRYMVTEKQMDRTEENPDIMNLKTSNTVTSPTTRNKIIMVGSDVVALFPSLTATEPGQVCEHQVVPDEPANNFICRSVLNVHDVKHVSVLEQHEHHV